MSRHHTDDELLRIRVLSRPQRRAARTMSAEDLERMNELAYRRRHRDTVSRDRWRVINNLCADLGYTTFGDDERTDDHAAA